MSTIDNIMALADKYAVSVADAPHTPTPLLRSMAVVEKIERVRTALRAALTEALTEQPIDTSTKHLEKVEETVQEQPLREFDGSDKFYKYWSHYPNLTFTWVSSSKKET